MLKRCIVTQKWSALLLPLCMWRTHHAILGWSKSTSSGVEKLKGQAEKEREINYVRILSMKASDPCPLLNPIKSSRLTVIL